MYIFYAYMLSLTGESAVTELHGPAPALDPAIMLTVIPSQPARLQSPNSQQQHMPTARQLSELGPAAFPKCCISLRSTTITAVALGHIAPWFMLDCLTCCDATPGQF